MRNAETDVTTRRKRRGPALAGGLRALFLALALFVAFAAALNACSDDDINFPGELPPVPPTAEPTSTPEPDEEF